MNFQKFRELFQDDLAAIEFESAVLSIGREFLPSCALAVLGGEGATEEYWEFLASQVEAENNSK
jgi:hypothetical protein